MIIRLVARLKRPVLLCAWWSVGLLGAKGMTLAHASAPAARPYAVVNKRTAMISVYDVKGRLVGSSPVLLGLTPGDRLPPGSRLKRPEALLPHERVTPAGQFEAVPGRNDKGEQVIWIDYESGLAIHRLRPAPRHERRPQRLASPTPEDNRISLGCVVVDPGFFESVVLPALGTGPSWVYVLPEEPMPEP